jgi:hypothetical protein
MDGFIRTNKWKIKAFKVLLLGLGAVLLRRKREN